MKADVMFETLRLLGIDYFTFHDLDIAPEGKSLKEFNSNVTAIANILEGKMAKTGQETALGHGQHVFQPALHGGRCHQS